MKEELARRGWTPEDLARRRKSDPEKLAIAAQMRKETTLSLKGIARLAWLGTSKGANTNLHKWMQRHEQRGLNLEPRKEGSNANQSKPILSTV
jgi:hypothetical protein